MDVIYLLDTNAWISYLNRRQSLVANHLANIDPLFVRLSSIVKAELYYGAYKSTRIHDNVTLIERLAAQFASIAFDDSAAR